MEQQNPDRADTRPAQEPDQDVVAAAAERILVAADRALTEIRDEVAHVAGHGRKADVETTPARRDDPAIAEIHEELATVQSELNEVSTGVIGLQAHGLRQTGVAALVLAVLIAVAWKAIEG